MYVLIQGINSSAFIRDHLLLRLIMYLKCRAKPTLCLLLILYIRERSYQRSRDLALAIHQSKSDEGRTIETSANNSMYAVANLPYRPRIDSSYLVFQIILSCWTQFPSVRLSISNFQTFRREWSTKMRPTRNLFQILFVLGWVRVRYKELFLKRNFVRSVTLLVNVTVYSKNSWNMYNQGSVLYMWASGFVWSLLPLEKKGADDKQMSSKKTFSNQKSIFLH